MQCPRCGANLPDDARFCGACGTDLSGAAPTQQMPQAPAPAGVPYPDPAQHQLQAPPPGQEQHSPAYQPPSQGYAPPQPFYPQQSAPKKRTGLIVGIIVGVLVLLLAMCGIGGALVYFPMFKTIQEVKTGSAATSSGTSSVPNASSTQGDATTSKPTATNPESPPANAQQAPDASPSEPAAVSLTKDSAIELVGTYLDNAKSGEKSAAKAVVTSHYLDQVTADYYSLAAKDLQQFEVVKVEKGQGGYMVFMKETWKQGVWTNWYLVVQKSGKLVIDNTGTD